MSRAFACSKSVPQIITFFHLRPQVKLEINSYMDMHETLSNDLFLRTFEALGMSLADDAEKMSSGMVSSCRYNPYYSIGLKMAILGQLRYLLFGTEKFFYQTQHTSI